jgi:hypothetical protein
MNKLERGLDKSLWKLSFPEFTASELQFSFSKLKIKNIKGKLTTFKE